MSDLFDLSGTTFGSGSDAGISSPSLAWDPNGGAFASPSPQASWTSSPFVSGALQTAAALGTGYLARRLDVDIQQRMAGTMPYPQQWGERGPIVYAEAGTVNRYGQRQPAAAAFGGGGLLPWLLIGAAVYFVAKKAK